MDHAPCVFPSGARVVPSASQAVGALPTLATEVANPVLWTMLHASSLPGLASPTVRLRGYLPAQAVTILVTSDGPRPATEDRSYNQDRSLSPFTTQLITSCAYRTVFIKIV
jgi:hypothetical protein